MYENLYNPYKRTDPYKIWINENHDTDWDGVPNYRDCNPLNPHQQGLFHKQSNYKKWVAQKEREEYRERKWKPKSSVGMVILGRTEGGRRGYISPPFFAGAATGVGIATVTGHPEAAPAAAVIGGVIGYGAGRRLVRKAETSFYGDKSDKELKQEIHEKMKKRYFD